jgi:phosphatidylserine/phosphatidylglycerophosphate/cardiolipin synthase-like enzyme
MPARPAMGHQVTPFVNVQDYYAAVGTAIRRTRKDISDFVYLSGWTVDLDTLVDPPGANPRQTLFDVLSAAAKQNVHIRFLLDDLGNAAGNQQSINRLKTLPNTDGLVDLVHPLAGSQHEKDVIIRNADGVVAFCGSADFENQRLGRGGVRGPKDNSGAYLAEAFHEVSVRIVGPAVRDIWNGFCLRYEAAGQPYLQRVGAGLRQVVPLYGLGEQLAPPSLRVVPRTPTLDGKDGVAGLFWPTGTYSADGIAAQTVRTLPNGTRQRLTDFNFGKAFCYPFAPAGEHSYYDVVAAAIAKTERYLYMEDQYFFFSASTVLGKSIARLLGELLAKPSFEKLIAVIAGTGTIQGETGQGGSRRRDFMQALGPERAKKASVYCYISNPGSPYWVHAKMWTFDDEFAVVGSANLNRRGYTSDVETGLAFCDPQGEGAQNLVKRLRMDLWEKHLNMPSRDSSGKPNGTGKLVADKATLADFLAAAPLWAKAPLLTKVDLESNVPQDIDLTSPQIDAKLIALGAGVLSHLGGAFLAGRERQWDFVIDPDGG